MGATLKELMAALPPERRATIKARSAVLLAELPAREELCRITDLTREQIAQTLGIEQPSLAKIEKQTDLYLSTLRRFVEAAGGTLELRVALPGKGVLSLTGVRERN